jgi:hypothetical protein
MNRVAIGVLTGITAVVATAWISINQLNKIQQDEKTIALAHDVLKLRANLIMWLMAAPGKGYTSEQINEYYRYQTAFIEQISK